MRDTNTPSPITNTPTPEHERQAAPGEGAARIIPLTPQPPLLMRNTNLDGMWRAIGAAQLANGERMCGAANVSAHHLITHPTTELLRDGEKLTRSFRPDMGWADCLVLWGPDAPRGEVIAQLRLILAQLEGAAHELDPHPQGRTWERYRDSAIVARLREEGAHVALCCAAHLRGERVTPRILDITPTRATPARCLLIDEDEPECEELRQGGVCEVWGERCAAGEHGEGGSDD